MPDPAFGIHRPQLDSPANSHFLITPDATELAQIPRCIYCETAGVVTIEDPLGTSLTYTVTAGQVLPFRAFKVTASTATLRGWI